MTRIISGFAGSLTLAVPKSGTRPTSDRVREAIFSALDSRDRIAGARVADLYAGSGALGLEAASRGATSVVLVEQSRQAAAVCRRNVEAIRHAAGAATGTAAGTATEISVATASVAHFLAANPTVFDLVFVDPPYDLGESALGEVLTALGARIAADATVVIERSSRSPEPAWPQSLLFERRKDYGETTLWWARGAGTRHPARPSQP